MPWLYGVLAAAALAVAFRAGSVALVVACLLIACVAMLAAVLGWLTERVGRRGRDDAALIDGVELQRLREQAEARRIAMSAEAAGADALR